MIEDAHVDERGAGDPHDSVDALLGLGAREAATEAATIDGGYDSVAAAFEPGRGSNLSSLVEESESEAVYRRNYDKDRGEEMPSVVEESDSGWWSMGPALHSRLRRRSRSRR